MFDSASQRYYDRAQNAWWDPQAGRWVFGEQSATTPSASSTRSRKKLILAGTVVVIVAIGVVVATVVGSGGDGRNKSGDPEGPSGGGTGTVQIWSLVDSPPSCSQTDSALANRQMTVYLNGREVGAGETGSASRGQDFGGACTVTATVEYDKSVKAKVTSGAEEQDFIIEVNGFPRAEVETDGGSTTLFYDANVNALKYDENS